MSKLTQIITPKRGALNDAAVAEYKKRTDRDLSVRELRLIPFISYTVQNGGQIRANQVNREEIEILTELNEAGLVLFRRSLGNVGFYELAVSDGYWNAMCRVLALTCVHTAV